MIALERGGGSVSSVCSLTVNLSAVAGSLRLSCQVG